MTQSGRLLLHALRPAAHAHPRSTSRPAWHAAIRPRRADLIRVVAQAIRLRAVHRGVQHLRSPRHQPSPGTKRNRAAHRRPAHRRAGPRRSPHPDSRPSRASHALEQPGPTSHRNHNHTHEISWLTTNGQQDQTKARRRGKSAGPADVGTSITNPVRPLITVDLSALSSDIHKPTRSAITNSNNATGPQLIPTE